MQKLITGFAAAAAFTFLVSAGHACGFHNKDVTASIDKPKESVAMSTYDGVTAPPIVEEIAQTAAAPECPVGSMACVPAAE